MPGGTGSEAQETFRAYFSCASLPELRAGCTPTSIFFIIFIYYFFFLILREELRRKAGTMVNLTAN